MNIAGLGLPSGVAEVKWTIHRDPHQHIGQPDMCYNECPGTRKIFVTTEVRTAVKVERMMGEQYAKRVRDVAQPYYAPPAHMLVVDFEGNKPDRLEPTIYHRAFYIQDCCDKPDCPRYRTPCPQENHS